MQAMHYVYGVRVISSAFFAMEVVRKGSPLETTERDEKEIQRQQRGAKTASTLSDGKDSTR